METTNNDLLTIAKEAMSEEVTQMVDKVSEDSSEIITPSVKVESPLGLSDFVVGFDTSAIIHESTNSSEEITSTNIGDIIINKTITDDDLKSGSTDVSLDFISDAELRELYPDMPDERFANSVLRIRKEMVTHEKSLITKRGFSLDEAREATINHFKKSMKDENDAYLKENPDVAIIKIDKTHEDDLMKQLSDEEKKKVTKAKVIKLELVENVDLESIEIEHVDVEHKTTLLQSIDNSLAKYSVPLLYTRDFVSFKGAQIIQMVNAVKQEKDTIAEVLSRKASLIYDRFLSGARLKKYDESGKVILSADKFLNEFKYDDIDMAIYAILCASSMCEVETNFTCKLCDNDFPWKYTLPSILDMSEIEKPEYENTKSTYNEILTYKNDSAKMIEFGKEKDTKVKSAFSNNIFVTESPSLAKALKIFNMINLDDPIIVQNAIIALYLAKLYIYNPATGKYVLIESDKYEDMLQYISLLPDLDIELLTTFLKPRIFKPRFKLTMKCPHCGEKVELNDVNIDDYVFMKAQSSQLEMTI